MPRRVLTRGHASGEGADEPSHHRLDLLGNRTVNRTVYVMSVTQARHEATGEAFLARKRAEDKTGKEARRAHKRQLANRLIHRMWSDHKRLHQPPMKEIAMAAEATLFEVGHVHRQLPHPEGGEAMAKEGPQPIGRLAPGLVQEHHHLGVGVH